MVVICSVDTGQLMIHMSYTEKLVMTCWNINPVSDVFSTLSEDSGSNCIYRDGQTARVCHCSDGPGYFQIKYVGLVDIVHPSNETKLM